MWLTSKNSPPQTTRSHHTTRRRSTPKINVRSAGASWSHRRGPNTPTTRQRVKTSPISGRAPATTRPHWTAVQGLRRCDWPAPITLSICQWTFGFFFLFFVQVEKKLCHCWIIYRHRLCLVLSRFYGVIKIDAHRLSAFEII